MPLGTAVVLGAAGGFGLAFSHLLRATGSVVTGVDLEIDNDVPERWLTADATCPDRGLLDAVAAADALLCCLPEGAAFAALDALTPRLPAAALVVDTMSVKTPVAAWASTAANSLEILSLNPMFAPDLPFDGHVVAAVPLRPGPRGDALLDLLRTAGASVVMLDADRHDRETALTQALVHAAVLAAGGVLAAHDATALQLVTPPMRILLLLLARMAAGSPEVYRHIQRDNPYAQAARARLGEELAGLGAATIRVEDFAAAVQRIRDLLEGLPEPLDEPARDLMRWVDIPLLPPTPVDRRRGVSPRAGPGPGS